MTLSNDQFGQFLEVHKRIATALEALVALKAAERVEDCGALCPQCGETDPEKIEDTSAGDVQRITCRSCGKSTEAP